MADPQRESRVEAVIRDDPEALAAFRAAMLGKEGGDKRSKQPFTGDIVTSGSRETGNSRAYSISRVQRECDAETVAAVMAGKMSPNAALVKAGVRERDRRPRRWRAALSGDDRCGYASRVNLSLYCSVAEACQIAGVSDGYMRRMLREGKVEGQKIGNTYLVLRSSVVAFRRQPGMGRPRADDVARPQPRPAARKARKPRK
jgi:excisionase family DNA binding protein